MKTTLDIETYSEVNLKTAGLYRYAEDDSTDILCACWAVDNGPINAWIPSADAGFAFEVSDVDGNLYCGPEVPQQLRADLANSDYIAAFNAAFERAVLNGPAGKRYNFPKLEIKQLRCSMARARYCSLPGGLEDASNELNTAIKKRIAGVNAMRYLCKPRQDGTRPTIRDERSRFIELVPYCADDVRSERCVDDALPEMSPKEQRIWEFDQLVNDRGVEVDLKALDDLQCLIDQYRLELIAKCRQLTTDAAHPKGIAPSQNAQLAAWIRANGWPTLEDLQADTVRQLHAKEEVPAHIKSILAVYSTYNMKAVSKFAAIKQAVCKDGRIRGMLLYHGAGTGRWSSIIAQLHNLYRPVIEDADAAIEAARARNLDWIRALYPGTDPMKVFASCVRGILVAREGHELVFPDFSGVESRWLAWMFGEEWKLDAYRAYDRGEGLKPYAVVYGRTFGVSPVGLNKTQMLIGKVLDLSMGYEGGVGAFVKMAKTYRLNLSDLIPVWDTLPTGFRLAAEEHYDDPIYKAKATGLSREIWRVCEALKLMWRASHPKVVQGWKDLKNAALNAVANPGVIYTVAHKRLMFKVEDDFLIMRLPSGRKIRYYKPYIKDETLHYRGVDTATRIYGDTTTYGGKTCENQAQGGCRDLLVDAMFALEADGWPITMHVHDEPVMEVAIGSLSEERVQSIMCAVPLWAEGFPLAIEAHRGKRYRK